MIHIDHPKGEAGLFVFDSPHSGIIEPSDFGYACSPDVIRKASDLYVHELFDFVPDLGAPLLSAQFCRSYIDVNRHEDDLDPEMIKGGWPDILEPSDRAKAGSGLIRRMAHAPITSEGRPHRRVAIYDRLLTRDEVKARIETCHIPYHGALDELIDTAQGTWGASYHINCHSMPSTYRVRTRWAGLRHERLPDIVLGNRGGSTCDPEFTRRIADFMRDLGYDVTINTPYQGAEIIRRHGDPSLGRHSIQIEINRDLYMDEDNFKVKRKSFNALKKNLMLLTVDLIGHYGRGLSDSESLPLAAE